MSPQEPVETSPPLSRARPCGRDSGLAGAAGSPSPGRSQPCPGGCGGRAGVHRVSRGAWGGAVEGEQRGAWAEHPPPAGRGARGTVWEA